MQEKKVIAGGKENRAACGAIPFREMKSSPDMHPQPDDPTPITSPPRDWEEFSDE